jgi:acyl carrier protein
MMEHKINGVVVINNSKIEKIIKTLKEVLKLNNLNEDAEMGSPPQWNSLTHVEILLELEKQFNRRIELHQLPLLTSVKKIELFLNN